MVTTYSKHEVPQLSADKYFNYIKRVHVQRAKKATLQMLSAARAAVSGATEVTTKVNEVMPKVEQAADGLISTAEEAKSMFQNVGEAAVAAQRVLAQLQTAMTPVQIIWREKDLLPTLLKIARIVANLAMSRRSCMVASLLLNVCSEFGNEVVATIKNWLFTPTQDRNARIYRAATQQGLNITDMAHLASVQGWIAENTKLTVSSLAVAIFAILQTTLGLPLKGMDVEKMLAFFGARCRHMKSMVDFAKSSWNIFTDVAEWMVESIFPGTVKHGLDKYLISYTKWAREVQSLIDPKHPVIERVKKDKKLVYQISALYKRGLQFSANLAVLKVEPDLRDHFQKVFRVCEGFLREADHSGVLGNSPRIKPFIIQLFGESGVGKSGMLWPLCADLNAPLCRTAKEAKDVASEVYFRSAEQEFWDGYAGQNICVWDDFGQLVDSSSNANPEFFEIIRAGNAAPYPLHMATLDEKARTKFISKFCILTSNKISQKISSITFPSAMRRRIDMLYKVEIKDEFAKDGFNAETGEVVKRLDPTKCGEGADTSVYQFVAYDPETQLATGEEPIGYDELVRRILVTAKTNFEASLDFNTSVLDRIDVDRHRHLRRLLMSRALESQEVLQTEDEIFGDEDEACPEEREATLQIDQGIIPEEDELDAAWEEEFGRQETVDIPIMQKSWFHDWKNKAKSWLTLKTVLVAVGTLLSGFGVWGLFKYLQDDEQTLAMPVPEGFSSGDNRTKKTRVLLAEASVSGDCRTNKHRVVHTEGIALSTAKAVTRALRHEIVTRDGWVKVDDLFDHLRGHTISRRDLQQIVREDAKGRFEYDPSQDRIRATQGHSFDVCPGDMYKKSEHQFATHFTYKSRIDSIRKQGVKTMNRAFVHMHPGYLTSPPMDLPGRNRAVWIDLTEIECWDSPNGYVLSGNIPAKAIVKVVPVGPQEDAIREDELDVVDWFEHKTMRKTRPEIEEEATLQAWKDKSAQELISHRILGNMYRISIDGCERLNGLFVRDTCMLTVQHLLPWLRAGRKVTIENMYGSTFTVPVSELRTSVIKDSMGNCKDAMLIWFPRYVNCHSDLVKHFQKMPELAQRRADVCLPCIRTLNDKRLFTILGNATCQIEHAHLLCDGQKKQIRDSLQYNLNTTNGDCGSPVIVNDTTFIRKIAGIHIAAYDDGSSAIGQSVTQADLLRHLNDFEAVVIDYDDLPNVATKEATLQVGEAYSKMDIVEFFNMPAETFGYIGQCTRLSSPPLVTDLRPSPIHGYVEPTTKPAKLRVPGVNMVHRNMEKCAVNTPYIDQIEIDQAVGEVKALLLSGESRSRLARVLTYEEAVKGSDISEYVDGIKRQSSPGYPHVFNKKPEFPGKTTWFGKDEWIINKEIEEIVMHRIELARQGIRAPTVWSDTLKDERRPIEKVDALKTRVFAHGPMDYTIALRMYFLGFVAHIMENRIANEQSLGTNPFGMDWLLTAKKLSRFGERVFAGDFSQFDGTLNSCILKEFAQVANDFYNDGEENARVREVLMLEVFNSVHLCSGKFIQLTHSQPSGNALTTVLNSFYNSVSMRIAFYRCFPEGKAPEFREHVSMVSYGDDNVVNFSSEVEEQFNQNTVTRAYETFGMIYTDEAKTFGEIADWRRLHEVNYLKRSFRLEDGMWRAPLSLETILESCNWIRKCPDPVEACTQNCETAFRELAQHPKEVFETKVKLIADALYSRTNVYPVIKTRLVYLEDDSPAW